MDLLKDLRDENVILLLVVVACQRAQGAHMSVPFSHISMPSCVFPAMVVSFSGAPAIFFVLRGRVLYGVYLMYWLLRCFCCCCVNAQLN